MAKAQKSFADKARQAEEKKSARKFVKVIRSSKDSSHGAVRFIDRMVAVPGDADLDEYLRKVAEGAD